MDVAYGEERQKRRGIRIGNRWIGGRRAIEASGHHGGTNVRVGRTTRVVFPILIPFTVAVCWVFRDLTRQEYRARGRGGGTVGVTVLSRVVKISAAIGYVGTLCPATAANTFSRVPRGDNSSPRAAAEPTQYFKKSSENVHW